MFLFVPYGLEELDLRRRPLVTYLLTGMNVAVFLGTVFLGAARRDILFMEFGFIPEEWQRTYPFITSMFLHAGWMHIIGNMYFLWLFGRAVEDRLGALRYGAFYLAAGVVAGLAHLATTPEFFSDIPCVGASGAVSGILGALMVMAPSARVNCFYCWFLFLRPIMGSVRVPAVVFLGGWFLIQLLYGLSLGDAASGAVGVAFWAHIGGFTFGALAAGSPKLLARGRSSLRRRRREQDFSRALQALREGNLQAAREELERLDAMGWGCSTLDLALARALAGSSSRDEAVRRTLRALRAAEEEKDRGTTIDAYLLLSAVGAGDEMSFHDHLAVGMSYAVCGMKDEAITVLLRGLEKHPGTEGTDLILYELGELYRESGNEERARDAYGLILKLHPESRLYSSAQYCLQELGGPSGPESKKGGTGQQKTERTTNGRSG